MPGTGIRQARNPFRCPTGTGSALQGRPIAQTYRPDFICDERIIVEIKALKELGNEHRAEVHNYLKATGFELGLLVNFGHYPKAEIERIVR
jgi:GxxExxY protein